MGSSMTGLLTIPFLCLWTFKRIQRRASRFIFNNFHLDYKSMLVSISLVPLSMWMVLRDVLSFLCLLKKSPRQLQHLSIHPYYHIIYSFLFRVHPKASLPGNPSLNSTTYYYFNRIIIIWISLPLSTSPVL